MSARQLATAWSIAIALAAAGIIFLTAQERIYDRPFLKGPIVAIGSSLMFHGIPATTPRPGGLLGDGRAHARFHKILMSEDETLSLVSRAVNAGATTVLVDASAFAYDLAFTVADDSDPWIIKSSKALLDLSNRRRSGFKWLLGYQTLNPLDEPETLNSERVVTPHDLASAYPMRLHPLHDPQAVTEVLRDARRKGAEVILIAFPRAQSAADYIGDKAQMALAAHLDALAQSLGIPLFSASPAWPDKYFIDTGHLNARGRARFVAELAAWWAEHAWHPKP